MTSKHSEKYLLKQVCKFQTLLMNTYHVPCAFVYLSKTGIRVNGSDHVKTKLSEMFDSLKPSFTRDNDEMSLCTSSLYRDIEPNMAFARSLSDIVFEKLPFPLDLLNLNQLISYLGM